MGSSSWSGEVLADAWLLSSRYLELALLHRMGVESPIRDRLNPERHDLALLDLLRRGEIHPVVSERLPLTDVRRAHELLARSAATGKLVLVP